MPVIGRVFSLSTVQKCRVEAFASAALAAVIAQREGRAIGGFCGHIGHN
jgi:hypothetical protein